MKTCFEEAADVLEAASSKFASFGYISQTKLDRFRDGCKLIDELIEAFDCTAMDICVDEKTYDIEISLVSIDAVVENGRNNSFFSLVTLPQVKAVEFRAEKDDLYTTFVFRGVWDLV